MELCSALESARINIEASGGMKRICWWLISPLLLTVIIVQFRARFATSSCESELSQSLRSSAILRETDRQVLPRLSKHLPCSYLTKLLRFFKSFCFVYAESLDFELATSWSKVMRDARFAGLIFGSYRFLS